MSNCIYCNSNLATDRDHVVPRAFSGNESFAERYTVPSCKECNILLSSAAVHTVEERASYLYTRYMKRYQREINAPDWTPAEIKQLSGALKKQIVSKEKHKKLINSKLLNLRTVGRDYLDD